MDKITTDLINTAMKNGYGVEITHEMNPRTTALTSYKHKKIIINSNYYLQKQIVFQFAHEVGHVLNGDASNNPLYYTPTKYKIEGAANRHAIDLLITYYFNNVPKEDANVVNFMESFEIPNRLSKMAIEEIAQFYD
ncbi:ImmA/IrrE family metallo-endopeptidase [Companilactobacillus sp. HBUAS59699]|uniref:ImmA/IrrE family metallo-endopeptidase n=1 Tax=Companilactobacillus sp. HBUAS59699 TaxID=3109358 RepID=UPI002FEF4C05